MKSLTESYRPHSIAEFAGLAQPKQFMAKLQENPYESAWLFVGPSGTGKTSMALALADSIPAQLHHIPSQRCTASEVERIQYACSYYPEFGKRFHLVLVDEADQMSKAAQVAFLSILDPHVSFPKNTIFVFTANDTSALEDRFLSRVRALTFSSYGMAPGAIALLERIWKTEAGAAAAPNFARIVKDANNNVRASLMALEAQLMLA